jgi:hypothetical protein
MPATVPAAPSIAAAPLPTLPVGASTAPIPDKAADAPMSTAGSGVPQPERAPAAPPQSSGPTVDGALAKMLPPALHHLQSPQQRATTEAVRLSFGMSLAEGEELTSIVVRRDGIIQPTVDLHLPLRFDGKTAGAVTVDVPRGPSVVHIVAANRHGFSDALAFAVTREPETSATPGPVEARPEAPRPPRASPRKPRLYVLAVGVGTYADPEINPLRLPGKDASDFAATLADQGGRVYREVVTRVLTDRQASKDAILQGLSWLSGSVGPEDYGMLFLAGHAVNHADGRYYFLSYDTSVKRIAASSVAESSIRGSLARLKGRAIFFVDTCFSGNVVGSMRGRPSDVSKIANDLASPENGVIVFASSSGRQESQEDASWGNGAFTKALLAGLKGGADFMRRGWVTFQGLGYFVSAEVEKLTRGAQTPVMIVPPPGMQDFPLALSGEATSPSRPSSTSRIDGDSSEVLAFRWVETEQAR